MIRAAPSSLFFALAFAVACNPSEASDDANPSDGSSRGDAASTSTSSVTPGSSGSSSAAGDSTSAVTSTTSGTTASEDGTTRGTQFACGDELFCELGEHCVLPCCGGAPPSCDPIPKDGECPPGTPEFGKCCDFMGIPDCDEADWCQLPPCEPAPPRCVTAEDLMCDQSGSCKVLGDDFCIGPVENNIITCQCA
ncbi:MAG: hypothetical protein AAF799_05300 [Myxococcota bacterium]